MGKHEKPGLFSDGMYDFLKQQAQITLPALGTLYFTLAQIWGLPFSEEVVGTIVALDAFLGLLLGYSNAKYKASDAAYDGYLTVQEGDEEDMRTVGVKFTADAATLERQKQAVFKIRSE